MLIDLHCHTKRSKKGDSPNRTVSPDIFKSAIIGSGVSIVGITNHNQFDVQQFNELSSAVGDSAQIWPGVELDVCGSGEGSHWHMIVLGSPYNLEQFSRTVSSLVGDVSPNDVMLHVRDVFGAFDNQNVIYVSHCFDKKPHLSEADIVEMEGLVSQGWRLFYEPRKLVTVGIWSNHGRNMILGSDVQDWNHYPGCELPSLRLPVSSFEQFCLLAQRDEGTVETLLGKRGTIGVVSHPCEGVDVPLELREDINVLFGQKGTGKTKIIESVEASLTNRGLRCCSYYGARKHADFKSLLSTDGIVRDTARFGRESCADEIKTILGWSDAAITPLSSYVEWWETRPNTAAKAKFKLTEAEDLPPWTGVSFSTDLVAERTIGRFSGQYKKDGLGRYLDDSERSEFERLLGLLQGNALAEARRNFIEEKSVDLANTALSTLKSSIEAKSDTRAKPGSTGFIAFARSRFILQNAVESVCAALEPAADFDSYYLGTLEDKGELYVTTRYRYLDSDPKDKSLTEEFDEGIMSLRSWKKAIVALRDSALTAQASSALAEFKSANDSSPVNDLSCFIGLKRFVSLRDRNNPYEPSNGEEGILLLEHKLSEDADVYLLDEVELGMSNSYINAVIRTRVQDLAHRGKTVIIATHNANLAVRTFPYLSIYREHIDGDKYATYVGNPFVDLLRDIEGVRKPLRWSDKSMEVLEGGEEAFYNRQEIYEAGMR